MQFVIVKYCFIVVVLFLIKNTKESIFCFSLKKWKVYRYKQNRPLSDTKIVKVKAKRGIPVTKFKSQIILMKKNGLNVEHFHYLITINYDKTSPACIRWPLGRYFKKEKTYLTNKKMLQTFF